MNQLSIDSSQIGMPDKQQQQQYLRQLPSHPQSAKSYRSVNQNIYKIKENENETYDDEEDNDNNNGQQITMNPNFYSNLNQFSSMPITPQNNYNKFFMKNNNNNNTTTPLFHIHKPSSTASSGAIGFPNTLINLIDHDHTKTLKKLMPKNIKKAKEVLYEGALVVKEKCNKLENENTKLKTQLSQSQKVNNKLQKLLYEIEESQNSGQVTLLSQPAVDNLLILTLKKEQKQLLAEIQQKDGEIQSLKRSVKQTRIEELEIQLKCYIEETLRLKIQLDLFLREKHRNEQQYTSSYQKEGKVYIQNQVIDKLKQQVFELKAQIIQLEERNQQLEVRQEIDEKVYMQTNQIQKLQQQISIQETLIQEQQNKIVILEEEHKKSKRQIQHYQLFEETYQTKLLAEQQLLKKMEDQEIYNQGLEAKLEALELEYQENQKKNEQEKEQLRKERDSKNVEGNKYQNPGERIVGKQAKNYQNYQFPSSLSHIEEDEDMFMRTKNGYVRTLQEINREKEIYDRQNAKKRSYQTVTPVTTDQISEICKTINNELSLKKISVDVLLTNYIFKEPIKSKGRISIENLIDIFSIEPFNLKEKDAENLARYLIEDNTQEIIQFRKHMDAENLLVRSRIRFVIGKVRIFTHEEEEKFQAELVEKIKKYGDGLYFQLTLNGDVKRTLKVTKAQVIAAMQYIDMDLNKSLSEYYFLKLFEQTKDPNKFNLDDCTKLFGGH